MKASVENTPVVQAMAPAREGEASTGHAEFEDHRSSTFQLRKLHGDMGGRPEDEGTAQLRNSMRTGQGQAGFPIQRKANRTGLPDRLKSGVENLSGYSMDDVKVHYNSSKPAQLQAHAYAQGTDIHVGPGQEKHLAHEAWHVVQQKQGRVQPTRQLKSKVSINDDAGLEREADVMGAKALHAGETVQRQELSTGAQRAGTVVQRTEGEEEYTQGKALEDLAALKVVVEEFEPTMELVDPTELHGEMESLDETLAQIDDAGERAKLLAEMMEKYKDLFSSAQKQEDQASNMRIKPKDILGKLKVKRADINKFYETGKLDGFDGEFQARFTEVIKLAVRVAGEAKEKDNYTSASKLKLGLMRVEELKNREVHQAHADKFPGEDIYIPASGKTNRATYVAHGDHTDLKGTAGATVAAPSGVTMSYTAPHGYDALASIDAAWGATNQARGRESYYNFSPGPVTRRMVMRRWYDYNLTPEGKHKDDHIKVNLQHLADLNKVTIIVIGSNTKTSDFVKALAGLGYSQLYPVHCRGSHGQDSRKWAGNSYDPLDKKEYLKQYASETMTNANFDPGPNAGENHVISMERLMREGAFIDVSAFMELEEDELKEGMIVQDQGTNLYYRLWGITKTQAFLRGLSDADGILMGQDDSYLEDAEDDSDEDKERKTRNKAQKAKLLKYHKNLDRIQRYAPWTLTGYSKFV